MDDNKPPKSNIILYQTEDGRTRIQCRFENETVWLTQALMAELFQVTPQNVTLHLKAIYAEGELDEAATCKEYLQVRVEGGRQITRALKHYSLPSLRSRSMTALLPAAAPDSKTRRRPTPSSNSKTR